MIKAFLVFLLLYVKRLLGDAEENWKASTWCRARQERFSRDGYVVPEARLEDSALSGLWNMLLTQVQAQLGRTDLSPDDLILDGRGELFGAVYDGDRLVSLASEPHTYSTTAQEKDSAELLQLLPEAAAQLLSVVYSPALRQSVSCVLPHVTRWRLLTYMKLTAKFREDRPHETNKWHQDAFLYNGVMGGIWDAELMDDFNRHGVTAFIAVSPIGRDMAALEYQPGAHKFGFVGTHSTERHEGPPEYSVAFQKDLPFTDGDQRSQTVAMEPGEFTLHSLYIPHATTPNTSPYARWGIEMRFVDADWAESIWMDRAQMNDYGTTALTLGWPLGEPFPQQPDDALFQEFYYNISSTLQEVKTFIAEQLGGR